MFHFIRSIINNKKPLWLRPPRDCSESEYSDFYKQTFNAYDEPAAHAHFSVEGNVDFKVSVCAFLFIILPFSSSPSFFPLLLKSSYFLHPAA